MRLRFLVKNKKHRAKLLISLLLIFAVMSAASALVRGCDMRTADGQLLHPVRAVYTEENIYAVTATLYGNEDEKDIELLLTVSEGLGVNITFFADADWAKHNRDIAKKLNKAASHGLFIDKKLNSKARSSVLEYIAKNNDLFFEQNGKYPKYVRFSYEPDQTLLRILNAYGQYCISYDVELLSEDMYIIQRGSIVDVGVIDDSTAYKLARAVSGAISNGMTCIGLESFLHEIGSETDEFGKQYA